MKTTVITGTHGFIGSNLAKKFDNTLLCDPADPIQGMSAPVKLLKWLCDTKNEVSAVYHLGAISSTTETDISQISFNNISFPCQIVEICIKRKIPFVYASSASVYGLGSNGFSEDSRMDPLNYYAISKSSFDMFVKQKIADNPDAKIVGLRYFNVYGQNEDSKGPMASPVHKFLSQSKSGAIQVFKGSEGFLRDFVHVDDVVDITKEAVSFYSGIYNVGTGEPRSFSDVAKIISKITGAEIKEIPFPKHLVGKYQEFTCSDNTKIDSVYKQDRILLEDGIRKVYDDRVC